MRGLAVAVFAGLVVASQAAGLASAQEARREVAPHVHGEGKLAIAIEGSKVAMELEAPAKDIIGFEHAPKTAKQKKALAGAKARLGKGLELFRPSPEAQCVQTQAKVDLVGLTKSSKKHNHAHDKHDHDHGDKDAHHAEFRVNYTYDCKSPAKLTSIALEYFSVFKGTEKLDISVIGPKGQTSVEASRDNPSIALGGVM